MASVEDCTDTFLRDFCAKGGTVIFLSKALSPTTMPNIQGMLVGELAALWAGATVRLVTSVVCCRVLYGLLTSLRNSGAARRRGIRLGTGVRLTHITAQLEHGSQERNACVWGFGFILTSLRNSLHHGSQERKRALLCSAHCFVLSPMGQHPPAE